MDKNFMVTKSNKLIKARGHLSLQEQRIVLTLTSLIQPDDKDLNGYTFNVKEFIEQIGVKNNSIYARLEDITKTLMSRVIEIREEKRLLQLNWLSSAEYNYGEGTINLQISDKLKPYLLELKEYFTSYKFENVMKLKSNYAIRVYELLKSYQKIGQATFSLDDFRTMVGATTKSYNTYYNVKSRIIDSSKKELHKHTDICFDYEPIKTGRRVTAIRFIIFKNTSKQQDIQLVMPKEDINFHQIGIDEVLATSENDIEILHKTIEKIFFSDIPLKETELLIQKYGYERVEQFKNDLPKLLAPQQTIIRNVIAWYKSMLGKDYTIPKKYENQEKSIYHQMAEREYTQEFYDSLYTDLSNFE